MEKEFFGAVVRMEEEPSCSRVVLDVEAARGSSSPLSCSRAVVLLAGRRLTCEEAELMGKLGHCYDNELNNNVVGSRTGHLLTE
ncbi:hypothetical protein Dimus_025305 [Dionaea muscipula]